MFDSTMMYVYRFRIWDEMMKSSVFKWDIHIPFLQTILLYSLGKRKWGLEGECLWVGSQQVCGHILRGNLRGIVLNMSFPYVLDWIPWVLNTYHTFHLTLAQNQTIQYLIQHNSYFHYPLCCSPIIFLTASPTFPLICEHSLTIKWHEEIPFQWSLWCQWGTWYYDMD